MAEIHTFGTNVNPISCHAWNADRTQLAVSFNNQEVNIFQRDGSEWKLLDVLNQHDLRIMGIDWAPKTNRIVTCAVDRNAYVWTQDADKKWKPTLVLLRINRAATCVKWSPLENKFAVGSGARLISVCYFEQDNNWWVSKHIKKPIRSTVTSLDWHPNNVLIVAGSTDYKVRIFSAYIKEIEQQPTRTLWGTKMPLGQLMAEFRNSPTGGGWIHGVSFSADGNKICWVGHDSAINLAEATPNGPVVTKVNTEYLPFLSCVWITPSVIVVAGHSCTPLLYTADGNKVTFVGKLDQDQKKSGGNMSAMKIFQNLDRRNEQESADTVLDSIHQNSITNTVIYSGDKEAATKISTSGLDNQLIIWDLKTLTRSMQGLNLN
uniref:Actin-related protein 2/3 complex subunit n=1 Tax=Culicoides sonorensis TaxID=179676 RepID=A0A336M8T0_CULSO